MEGAELVHEFAKLQVEYGEPPTTTKSTETFSPPPMGEY